jgi:hypothetical protein
MRPAATRARDRDGRAGARPSRRRSHGTLPVDRPCSATSAARLLGTTDTRWPLPTIGPTHRKLRTWSAIGAWTVGPLNTLATSARCGVPGGLTITCMVDLPPPPVPIDADLLPDMPLKVGRLLRPVAREARTQPTAPPRFTYLTQGLDKLPTIRTRCTSPQWLLRALTAQNGL